MGGLIGRCNGLNCATSEGIGVASSITVEVGTWTDCGSTGVISHAGGAYNAIGGNLVLAGVGSYYMSFESF